METAIPKDWTDWIQENVDRGVDLNELFGILLQHRFDYRDVFAAMERCVARRAAAAGNPPPPARRLDLPQAQRVETGLAELFVWDGFLAPAECARVVELVKSRLRPSTITTRDEPDKSFRTSRTCDLGILDDPLMAGIDARICGSLGLDPAYGEITQGQYYEVGQQFKAHTDYFTGDALREFGGERGQRTFTFMVYLNDTEAGGETEFTELGRRFAPRTGRALVWNNLDAGGRPNPMTKHQAHPVERGDKAVITKWFRERPGR